MLLTAAEGMPLPAWNGVWVAAGRRQAPHSTAAPCFSTEKSNQASAVGAARMAVKSVAQSATLHGIITLPGQRGIGRCGPAITTKAAASLPCVLTCSPGTCSTAPMHPRLRHHQHQRPQHRQQLHQCLLQLPPPPPLHTPHSTALHLLLLLLLLPCAAAFAACALVVGWLVGWWQAPPAAAAGPAAPSLTPG
ncbi:hypothetical protein COO60DRAFT_745510 [Scenedesmus sp. NREL 46B-D3]|nr:hypothetical protein COO60DRAFT_745510 [Scenedesmus sp. NREL 46B-D3]